MGPSPAKPGSDKCGGPSDNVYYGVYLPPDIQPSNEDPDGPAVFTDKSEALKLVKKYKKARFKAFRTLADATQFAALGPETTVVSPLSATTGEKPSPFRGPKPQDMVRLRKAIEAGDLEWVKKVVWENPRYLVSSGDTPSILQEGPRYNALHIAAKARNAAICAFILETVSNPEFMRHLYGDMTDAEQRCTVLLDLYLNTPEHKALNETPLHFASKFGAAKVVQVLVAYPQCDRTATNKFNNTAKDIVCSRMPGADSGLKEEILAMLEEQFYVPVLRSPDHSVEAMVGKPFSPLSPLQEQCGDVTSPVLEVQAVAGPMPKQTAEMFRRMWKTPPRIPGSPLTSRRPQLADQDKGWEKVGRELAQEWKVAWKEYWPFLNTYVDLSSQEGLQLLEDYLHKRFKSASEGNNSSITDNKPTPPKTHINGMTPESPVSELCSALRACRLSCSGGSTKPPPPRHSPPTRAPAMLHHNGDIPTHVTSPHLYMEKSCQVFAKRIADGFQVGEGDTEFLWVEVKHLNVLVASCRCDNRFAQLDFHCLHARLGQIVAQRLDKAELTKVTDCLHSLINRKLEDCYSSDEDDPLDLYVRRPHIDHRDRQTLFISVLCVARAVLAALDTSESFDDTPASEQACADVWALASRCNCTFPTKHGRHKLASQKKLNFNDFNVNGGGGDLTSRSITPADSSGEESDTSDTSECEFFTPPSSPGIRSDDDQAMESPDEGPDVYITGNMPSKLDMAVMEAIRTNEINKAQFPNICRWRHLVLLHSEQERQRWYCTTTSLKMFDYLIRRIRDTYSVSKKHSVKDLVPPVEPPKKNEFRSSTIVEQLLFLLGVLAAMFMGALFSFVIVVYSEFLNLMIARQSPDSVISNSYTLQLFGGGSTNSSGTHEERMNRLLDDSLAYAIAQTATASTMFLCAVLSIYLLNYSAQKRVGRMRRQFLRAVLYQDMSWHDTQNTGAFASQLTDSLDKVQEGFGEKVGMFVYLVTTFVVSVVAAMLYGWQLALVMTAICPVFILVTALVARVQTRLTAKEVESYGDAGAVVEEVLANIRTVTAFGGEDKEVNRYNQKLVPARRAGIESGIFSGFGGGVSWMLIFFSYAIAFWYGTPLILADRYKEDKTYTPGVLLLVLFGVVSGAMNLGFCTPHLEAFAKARGGYKYVMSILRRKPLVNINERGVVLESKLGELEFKNVHFTYPARPDVKILKGLSFKVKKGESVALVGGSGSGKSTTIQLIERFYDPESGCVNLNGVDLKNLDLKWVRGQIGLVGQEPVLFNTTIAENICCDLKVTRVEMEEAAREANAHDFIMKLPAGYDTMVGERGSSLSGGQKQRIAIARALLRRPSILLLDEATSALDMANEAVVQGALERASHGRTTITVSHRLSSIRNVDRILVLANGRLVEEGSHSDLMEKKGHYYALVTSDASLQGASSASKNDKADSQTNGQIPLEEVDVIPKDLERKEDSTEEDYEVPILKILSLNKPEWPYVLCGSVFSFLNGCISPVSAVFFGNMFWAYSSPDDSVIISAGNRYALDFIGLGIFSLICVFLQFSSLTVAGVRMTTRLRVNVFKAMLKQEMAWFDEERNSVGSLSARLSGDTSTVQGATGSKLGTILQAVSTLGVGALLSLFYCWKMTIVCLLCIPCILYSIVLESRVMHSEDAIEKKALEEATKIAVEAIMTVRTVQSLGLENAVLDRYTRRLLEAEESLRKKTRYRGIVFGLGQTSTCFAYGFSLSYGGYLIAKEGESYQNINIVAEALLFGAWILAQAISFAPSLNLAKIAAGRLFKILDRKPKIYSASNTASSSSSWKVKGDIECRDVHFSYPSRPDHRILQGLQLSITRGQKVALVGPSGCGKSTCVQLLQRFYDPVSGSLRIDGTDSVEIPTARLRAELGIVSQEPVLFDRTIAENIAYGDNSRTVSIAEVVVAARQANVHSFISSLPDGYETRMGSRGAQLSGGQKQRIAIARSLVRNPQILILDEATSALDSQSEKMVQEALDEASAGRTCIMIAHRLSTVTNADVICVLSQGMVVEMGSHSQLLSKGGHYARQLIAQH